MAEPQKPFACSLPGCGKTFTNEDHLHVHTKKHDMVLQFGLEQKAAFVADQTPTPTRFIRNCEEVGLFQDLQSEALVNPFDEGFKRAMETKASLCVDSTSDDVLHTPQMFPLIDGDALYASTNNRNITISRSSSDESGAVKEYETTTISKLTNEVTTISRIVEKQDSHDKSEDTFKDIVKENSVSYTNNVIKIHSSNIMRKDMDKMVFTDSMQDVTRKDLSKVTDVPPIMSQKSLDFVVDSLNIDNLKPDAKDLDLLKDCEVTVTIKGKKVKMRAVEEYKDDKDKEKEAKDRLKKILESKIRVKDASMLKPMVPNVLPLGTLIPVTVVSASKLITNPKLPIPNLNSSKTLKEVRKGSEKETDVTSSECKKRKEDKQFYLEMRSAASKRYRERLKEKMSSQGSENKILKDSNIRLKAENSILRQLITEHMATCSRAAELNEKLTEHNL